MTTTRTTSTVPAPAPATDAAPTLAETAPAVLSLIAGYVGHRTVATGLRSGLLRRLADTPGSTPDDLAEALGMDPFYVAVWCRAALGAGLLERDGAGVRLREHMATLLLDSSSPAFVGGVFGVLEAPEVFGRFEASLSSGERMWWEDTSPEWIAAVAGTGTPFYTRLVPGGLERVPGLAERLDAGCRIVDTACGAGVGAVRLATTYPRCTVTGVDGDAHSIALARERVEAAGVADRVTLVHSALEDMAIDDPATLVVNNISMHECRDIDRVAANVRAALEPGGWFVISDFPFPDTDEGLRAVPGRIMSGIQFFEAQIDDQLLPRAAYDELLGRHGFTDLGSVSLTPMHALTWGRRP
ncbi:Methyltransferase domain-containing protein [Blastococcus aurantiacus]|uniref:Methyltransferase domain-containing protein n=1 Tax=Blastococcus aurantiacus TaxID=1550231 RepID=A0A1G7LUU0_9ACTN|nr:class I SAM-dependent methyltransferase [Blastococcus aurantiacus]SDF53181.1 Methyltransferase domain-containing protein [Blastococcus aurantiacus]